MPTSKPPLERTLEALLVEHRARLRAAIARHCTARTGLDADEVEQEVRIRLWKALASETVIDHPASYLHRVTLSVIVDLLRKRQARPDCDPVTAPDNLRAPSIDARDPQRLALQDAAAAALLAALGGLPERRRRPVQLHLQGFTTVQVARLLAISEAAARNLVYRGMDELRARLRAQGWDDEPFQGN